MESNYRRVAPGKGAAPYIGGKRMLARRIIERIESLPHAVYAEVFVGMGGVFFRRRFAPKAEVINDRSRDVATFFRVLQRHHQAFLDEMKWKLGSRAEFQRLMDVDPDTLTDLERSARFYYLQKLAFGGKVAGRNFGVDSSSPSGFNIVRLASELQDIHERLSGVTIECLDFEAFLDRYDRPGALFYLDPPYWGSEGDYGKGAFCRDDFGRLANRLRNLKGHFLLSLNDTPGVRECFEGFDFEEVHLTYTITGAGAKQAAELIIADCPCPAGSQVGQGNLI
ncbi:DNA adenine methylase [Parvibaculum sp.]|uniref:DNA adenine methylase n=1 Tax=Parvibaculum sp. TaxID=2024848 RepID=UPI000C526EB4|nr:DNA adenine methylase [Parvibaculum sp.]MAM95662.1 DNA methyltransferase [Parvibaculum sp.]|tara:strand:- start:11545 stop:12387 length:843 start_codon:yes stop_codon:yes gene_type:complete